MSETPDQEFRRTTDVGSQRVARVYAGALLGAAEDQGQADALREELDSLVQDVFKQSPDLEEFLGSGAIGRHHKKEILRSVFDGRASPTFANFLQVLNEHQRLDLLRPVRDAYADLLDQRRRRVRVQVRSAAPLADDQVERLTSELRETFHLEPVLERQVDPGLIGGLVVRVGDWLYDASVRTRLDTIRTQLTARSSHEIQSRRDRFSSPDGD